MCAILLPIKPEYVNKILNQTKLYEYRKNKCKKKVNKIIIYSTAPVKKIVAEVEVKEMMEDTPINLWNKTGNCSGISKTKYMKYFQNKEIAFAYKLGNVVIYDNPKELKDLNINYYPQSHVYIDDEK